MRRTRERLRKIWRRGIAEAVIAVVRAGARLCGYPEDVFLSYFTERKLRDETGCMRFSVLDADPRTRPYPVTWPQPGRLTREGLAAQRMARMRRTILEEERSRKREWKPPTPSTPWERVVKQICDTWMAVAESRARRAVRSREVQERLEALEQELRAVGQRLERPK